MNSNCASCMSSSSLTVVLKVRLQKKKKKGRKRVWLIVDPRFKRYEAPPRAESAAVLVRCKVNVQEIWFNINPGQSEVLKVQQIANNVQPSMGNKYLSS